MLRVDGHAHDGALGEIVPVDACAVGRDDALQAREDRAEAEALEDDRVQHREVVERIDAVHG